MKKLLFLPLLLVLLSSFASFEYIVKVEDKKEFFEIDIKTFEKKNSICSLIIDNMEIVPSQGEREGFLVFDVIADPNGKCLMAFGHHRGKFVFKKYEEIPLGLYHLIINSQDYGFLNITQEETHISR